jgi:hypothetical protein
MPFWIALVLVVFVGIAGVAVFIMRRSGRGEEEIAGSFSMEAQPAEDIYSMAGIDEQMMSPIPTVSLPTIPAHAATNEHGQTTWADETGVSWCQEPDGTLRRYDAESGTWVSHQ